MTRFGLFVVGSLSCLRADVSISPLLHACNKGNRRRLHVGNSLSRHKNVHIKVFILDIFKIGLHYSASSFEFVMVFVSWNAGKVPDFSTSAKGTKGRLTSKEVVGF